MKEGKSGIEQLEFPDVNRLKVKTGGQIKNFDPSDHFELRQVGRMDRFSQFALLAANEAITTSGLKTCKEDWSENAGIILGSSIGGIETINYSYKQVFEEGHNRLHPLTIPKIMNNSATSLISIEYKIQGPSFPVSSACSSANHAMGLAYETIKSGKSKIMITGTIKIPQCSLCMLTNSKKMPRV